MSGIKETKEAVKLFCGIVSFVAKSMDDGKPSLGYAASLLPILYQIPSAFDGIGKIPEEASDFDQDELNELKQLVQNELKLPDEKVEELIEGSLEITLQLFALVKRYRA